MILDKQKRHTWSSGSVDDVVEGPFFSINRTVVGFSFEYKLKHDPLVSTDWVVVKIDAATGLRNISKIAVRDLEPGAPGWKLFEGDLHDRSGENAEVFFRAPIGGSIQVRHFRLRVVR